MRRVWSKSLFYITSFLALSIMALTSGCASGGFKLTRQYAGFVNKQNILLRVVLYILTLVVFAVTILIDLVVFNTMDFWDGKVSEGSYYFKDKNKNYYVQHEYLPETKLRRSTILVKSDDGKQLQEVVLTETISGEIEMHVDGKLRTRVRDISSVPMAAVYNEAGKLVEDKAIWPMQNIATFGR